MAATAGIDVGGTKVLGVVLDSSGAVVREERAPTPRGAEALLHTLTRVAMALGPVPRLGVGVAGLVTREGVLRAGPNLPGITELAVREELAARLGRDITVENDGTCACFAEWRVGAGQGARELAMITLGTGIGSGFVIGGSLQRGAQGFTGEPGHMVVDPNGRLCVCGQRGCWERYASGSGLAALGREAAEAGQLDQALAAAGGDPQAVRGEDVAGAARAGDRQALAVMDRFAWWVALGLVNVVNLVDPEVVALGGGVTAALDLVLEPVGSHVRELIYGADHRRLPRIVAAELGERAGAIGAALLAAC